MLNIEKSVKELTGCSPESLPEHVMGSVEPLVLKGLVSEWPAVQAAKQSNAAADSYLRRFYQGAPVSVSVGPPEIGGRIFYNEEMTELNFRQQQAQFDVILDKIHQYQNHENPAVFYMGSTPVDYCLPGFREKNDLDLGEITPLIRLWVGNRTRIAAHYDITENIACIVVGKRRFTLFPPDQLENLYIGPIDFTPAGQAISLVDFQNPDFDRYPRFHEALQQAQVAELEPGDAIFIPSMWWHHVEGLDSFNMLVNYWWRSSPAYMGSPLHALNHALLSIRDLPETQRKVWQDIFNFYVFDADESTLQHIPPEMRGVLAPIDELAARKLRALLLKQLNR